MSSVKGKLFEFFVCKLLLFCGFKPVVEDGLLVFEGGPGMMVQGLGQAHNADVLLEPPFQTPFYFSTRLLVECKCYNDAVGLSVIRNALGLREDINRFDIVTEEILKNRRLSYTKKITCYPMRRYTYQVAVASMSGFKSTTIPFAQTHRIPLISFSESTLFADVRNCIEAIDRRARDNKGYANHVLQHLRMFKHDRFNRNIDRWMDEDFISFIDKVYDFEQKIAIGLLENGTIIFMIKMLEECCNLRLRRGYDDGCEIYWNRDSVAWELYDKRRGYTFELPKEIYEEWIKNTEEKKAAVTIKQRYFSHIVVFENTYGEEEEVRTIHLSESFIESAKRSLEVD